MAAVKMDQFDMESPRQQPILRIHRGLIMYSRIENAMRNEHPQSSRLFNITL